MLWILQTQPQRVSAQHRNRKCMFRSWEYSEVGYYIAYITQHSVIWWLSTLRISTSHYTGWAEQKAINIIKIYLFRDLKMCVYAFEVVSNASKKTYWSIGGQAIQSTFTKQIFNRYQMKLIVVKLILIDPPCRCMQSHHPI